MRIATYSVVAVSVALVIGCGKDDSGRRGDRDRDTASADAGVTDGGIDNNSQRDGSTSDSGTDPDGGTDDGGGIEPYVPSVAELDPEFGRNGLVTFGSQLPGVGALWDVEVQDDGKLVGFGRNFEGMVAVRVTQSGRLDSSFGNGGFAYMPWGQPRNGFYFQIGGMELDDQGGLVIASHIHPIGEASQRAVVVRLTPDGELDTSFAESGIYSPDPVAVASSASAVALQSDGSIVFAGQDGGPAIIRLTPSGALDPGFGTAGRATATFGGQATDVIGLTALADDRIIFTGQTYADANAAVGLGRLSADGALDTSFGGGTGWVVDSAVGTAQPTGYNVAVAPDGDLVVAAGRPLLTEERGSRFAVGRYSADGTLVETFGTDGWATETGIVGRAFDVAVQTDGTVVAVGTSQWPQEIRASVVGFTDSGALDAGFAQGGLVQPVAADALGVALQPDGKIVTVGGTGFTRYLPDGTPDPGFGSLAPITVGHPVERATAIAVQADGKILVGGDASIGGGGMLIRLTPDGMIDPAFNSGFEPFVRLSSGVIPRTIAFDGQGRIFVGGPDFGSFLSPPGFRVARLSADGVADTEFGAQGFAAGTMIEATQAQTSGMAFVDDDTIYLGGFFVFESSISLGVLRLDAEGVIDSAWGESGLAAVPVSAFTVAADAPMHILALADGGVVVAALGKVYRFDGAGVLDATFGTDGVVPVAGSLAAIIVDGSDGFLTLAAVTGSTEGSSAIELSRRLLDGSLDPAFGNAGVVREEVGGGVSSPMGLSIMPDGVIVVAASRGDAWRQDALTMRFDAAGTLDGDFGDRGQLVMRLSDFSSALHAISVDATGRAIVAGRAWTASGGSDFAVARFR